MFFDSCNSNIPVSPHSQWMNNFRKILRPRRQLGCLHTATENVRMCVPWSHYPETIALRVSGNDWKATRLVPKGDPHLKDPRWYWWFPVIPGTQSRVTDLYDGLFTNTCGKEGGKRVIIKVWKYSKTSWHGTLLKEFAFEPVLSEQATSKTPTASIGKD